MEASCPLQDCHHTVTGSNEAEVMGKLAEHGRKEHGITEVSEDLKSKIRKTFKT